jgi:hypothetical protein
MLARNRNYKKQRKVSIVSGKAKHFFFAAFGAAICLWFSACIPIPTFSTAPLQEEELHFLEQGETTLEEIHQHFGKPQAIRSNGGLLLYGKTRAKMYVLWMYMETVDHIAYLFIEMNEDNRLYRYEVVREFDGCVSWGPCLDTAMYDGLMYPIRPLEAPLADDTIILFNPHIEYPDYEPNPEGQCKIIAYLGNKSSLKTLRVQIDKSPKRAISKNVYLKKIVAPGDHTLTVHWPLSWQMYGHEKESSIRQNISCNSGESVFVSVFTTSGGIIRSYNKINMETKSTTESLKTIKERHPIID